MAELVQNNYHFLVKNKEVNIRQWRNPSVANALVLIPAPAGQPFFSLGRYFIGLPIKLRLNYPERVKFE